MACMLVCSRAMSCELEDQFVVDPCCDSQTKQKSHGLRLGITYVKLLTVQEVPAMRQEEVQK